MKSFEESATFTSVAAPDAVWRALCASGALERDGSFPDAEYEREPRDDGAGATIGRAALGPFAVEWEEPAWTWEAPRRVTVERVFRRGPFARFVCDTTVAPEEGGSRVEQAVTLEAQRGLGTMLAPIVLARRRTAAAAAVTRAIALAEGGGGAAQASAAGTARFVDALDVLRPHSADDLAVASRLAAFVERSGPTPLGAMRPFGLADAWGLARERVAAAMLAAAREGLLDYDWRIVCPGCGGWCGGAPVLSALPREARCEGCELGAPVELDRTVEIVFDGRASDRGAVDPDRPTGPRGAPRAHAQLRVAPHLSAEAEAVLATGPHRIRAGGADAAFGVEDGAGARSLGVSAAAGALRVEPASVLPGTVRIAVVNDSARHLPLRVSAETPAADVATAARIVALQAFRDLFPEEAVAAGTTFPLREQTMLFTDVAGATRLYEEFGDVRASALIAEQFETLHDVVAVHRGALVKTTGDGAMAVFAEPRDAALAAQAFAAAAPLPMRAGAHVGPCVALRANERLDYAGATVALAARVARAAGVGEVLFTAALAGDARVRGALPGAEHGTLALRGLAEPLDVVRVRGSDAES